MNDAGQAWRRVSTDRHEQPESETPISHLETRDGEQGPGRDISNLLHKKQEQRSTRICRLQMNGDDGTLLWIVEMDLHQGHLGECHRLTFRWVIKGGVGKACQWEEGASYRAVRPTHS